MPPSLRTLGIVMLVADLPCSMRLLFTFLVPALAVLNFATAPAVVNPAHTPYSSTGAEASSNSVNGIVKLFSKLSSILHGASTSPPIGSILLSRSPQIPVISWDNRSLVITGSREILFSGEFHPFRLPVPSLWLDVLEKMAAAGLNTVSFQVPWCLYEGQPGVFRADGVFDLSDFFKAAKELGLWVIARPGLYIREFLLCCLPLPLFVIVVKTDMTMLSQHN